MEASMRAILVGMVLLAAAPSQAMTIASNDFKDGTELPLVHVYPRCGGENVSPELHWSGVPANTKSLVLTMIDGDVRPSGWSHWIVTGLSPSLTSLPHGLTALPPGAAPIPSNFGDPSYDGPCPPAGSGTHHYRFTIWALPTVAIAIAPDAKADDIAAKLSKAAIAQASVTGWVKR
jgi:Raf kinase inhibitor-like YbhB/YbcL family protein